MRIKSIAASALSALLFIPILSLSGCGGGGTTAGSGATVNGISQGTITAVAGSDGVQAAGVTATTPSGSIQLNGVNFKTSGARIKVHGVESPESALKVGMVVKVKGAADDDHKSGTAEEIEIEENLKGPVSAVNAQAGTLVVLEQTVSVDDKTVFDGVTGLNGLAQGTMVEVSGLTDASGVILATRIEKKSGSFVPNSTKVELKGTVGEVFAGSFTIGTLKVNSSKVPTGLEPGSLVEVEGTLAALNGPLAATDVELEKPDMENGQSVSIEGFVTNFVSFASFKVNGIVVSTQGLSDPGIKTNVKVRVEGKIVAGVLVASRIVILTAGTPAPTPTPAPLPDGAALYAANCASCHNPLATSAKKGATAAQIQVRMAAPPYATRVLTAAEVQAIAKVLVVTPAPAPAPTPTPAPAPAPAPAPSTQAGKVVYDSSCAGCHSLGTYDISGFAPNLSKKGSLVSGKFSPSHNGVTLTAAQIADISAFLNAN